MRIALVNPRWTFEGSIYFGCREPHLPLEYGYARALLERAGHDVLLLDAQLHDIELPDLTARLEAFAPDFLVVTTAPSYLFWRCAPPELRVPHDVLAACAHIPCVRVIVGPHASTTPATTLDKLDADVAILGECEESLVRLVATRPRWDDVPSIAHRSAGRIVVQGGPAACDLNALPPLEWPAGDLLRHRHHHHRFDAEPTGPGAEIEFSRGCPYHCTFCAKDNFRDDYRRRPVAVVIEELRRLRQQSVEYVYFIDEIFLPNRELLQALVSEPVPFGIQTRIDLWSAENLELLGAAGCVSIEAGVESISVEGRNLLDKNSRLTTKQIADRLICAKSFVPFVQANLLESGSDSPEEVQRWREHLLQFGIWANSPVPMFPYPGSPGYAKRWGAPDDEAWERAMDDYLRRYAQFSDIQDAHPRPLDELEAWLTDARRAANGGDSRGARR